MAEVRDILVVGAGPVGLTAALAVRATGRPVTVVETGGADRVRPGSRAIFLHRVTLDVLNRIRPGLGWELVHRGLTWRTKRTLYRGREVFRRTYAPAPADVLPAATSLPQVVTEAILLEASHQAGVEFVWNQEVASASARGDAVHVTTVHGATLAARYVIGADGSRSAVRESAGLRLEGPRTSSAFVIVDTAEDAANPLPLERVFHYEHPSVGFRNVLFVPFAGHWRVDLQCRPGDDPDGYGSDTGVRDWLARVMPARYAERVTWVSTYIFRQAIANRFADASMRMLLAGEAAHLFAPFGARGLNSGVADAFVAAQAIDRALSATTPEAAAEAIGDFAEARRAAALRNRAASSDALRHLEAASPLRRAIRRTAALVAPGVPAVGRWMDRAPYGPPLGGVDRHGMYY
ncbi:MAG: FAD-dependent monooxygenase [Acidobacteria bacterium]|nr:FAD-dependent monooxygenase [Acidobacteriota bacterium]